MTADAVPLVFFYHLPAEPAKLPDFDPNDIHSLIVATESQKLTKVEGSDKYRYAPFDVEEYDAATVKELAYMAANPATEQQQEMAESKAKMDV